MKKLLLIDGHAILHRAYYGIPKLTNSKGVYTNAVYGFLNIMFKFLDAEEPDYFIVAFDMHGKTFRHEMFAEYKGTRKPMEPELKSQIPLIQDMLDAMDVPVITKQGLEADDLLGTMAKLGEEAGLEVTIVTGDRDLLQLATDHTKIAIPKTKMTGTELEEYYKQDVIDAYGVTPTEFIDVKALWGDTADNIPGVPKIGEKSAKALIAQYHSIEEVHAHADELKPAQKKNILEFWDQAVMSKELATIEVNADIDFDLEAARLGDLYTPAAYSLCQELEFKNMLARFEVTSSNDVEESFKAIHSSGLLSEVFEAINKSSKDVAVGLSYALDGDNILAIGLSIEEDTYVVYPSDEIAFNADGSISDINADELSNKLVEISNQHITVCRNIKDLLHVIPNLNRDNCKDIAIADYLVNPLKKSYESSDIATTYFDMFIPTYEELVGKKDMATLWDEASEGIFTYLAYDAYISSQAYNPILDKLSSIDALELYRDLEMPLVFTLFDMEVLGIAMDDSALTDFGAELSSRISELEESIYSQAGCQFNINSPKQLGEILFSEEHLGLSGSKKTKSGYSTAAAVLEKLAPEHEIIADILEYRQLAKLNSTYVEGLKKVLASDGRIHSTFQQTVTATGRLSSTEPNLQNIPIRLELGRQIRKVFYAQEGYTFLDADYSQIELRVLAHMSGDENLINAFNSGLDVHTQTASRVFNVDFDQVTDLQRRAAKAVNFGIVYGESSFGLSENLGISNKEAKKYIEDYFVAYPKMKAFLDGLVSSAKETGYATTMLNRRRPIPELSDSNFMKRSFGERVAMNSPIQGTAADIIKIAMVSVHKRLLEAGLESRLILTVHDELLIETKESELDQVKAILEEAMTGAVKLSVPLEIDMHSGKTWFEAK